MRRFTQWGGLAMLDTIEIHSNNEVLGQKAKALTERFFVDDHEEKFKVSEPQGNEKVSKNVEMDEG